jgi:hypothetical protein
MIVIKSMPSFPLAAVKYEMSKLPAKKRLLQQNAIQTSLIPPTHSTSSNSTNNNNNNSMKEQEEPMDEDEDEEINVQDEDSPLDMRITKQHDSDSDSVRPSVIRRAPSFKETNSNSPSGSKNFNILNVVIIWLFLDHSSTDPFIDEHFRRSLGTDYDLIMRNKQLEQEKQRMLEEQQMILQQQQQQQAAAALQAQENILKLKHHKKHQIHQHHQAMLNIQQQENQLPIQTMPIQVPIVAVPVPSQIHHHHHLQQQPQAPQPPPPQSQAQSKKQVIITEHSDANESMTVDDHFAKALGDAWTKIQNESSK